MKETNGKLGPADQVIAGGEKMIRVSVETHAKIGIRKNQLSMINGRPVNADEVIAWALSCAGELDVPGVSAPPKDI